jgi:hypothetical protein
MPRTFNCGKCRAEYVERDWYETEDDYRCPSCGELPVLGIKSFPRDKASFVAPGVYADDFNKSNPSKVDVKDEPKIRFEWVTADTLTQLVNDVEDYKSLDLVACMALVVDGEPCVLVKIVRK